MDRREFIKKVTTLGVVAGAARIPGLVPHAHYAMNLPVSGVITGCDSMAILEQALVAARTFRPWREQEVAAQLAKTAGAAGRGRYELYKTTNHFDSTVRHPEWLG